MTKYILLMAFSVLFHLGFSQKQQNTNNSNIVFVHFNESIKEQKKTTKASYEDNKDKKPYIYFFYFYNTNGILEKVPLTFNFMSWSDKEKEQPLRFRVHKSFLRKNEDIILNQKTMYKIGKEITSQIFEKAKTIFLIDESQKKNHTILIKEVFYLDRRPI